MERALNSESKKIVFFIFLKLFYLRQFLKNAAKKWKILTGDGSFSNSAQQIKKTLLKKLVKLLVLNMI